MAPATPAPNSKSLFAALTIASTAMSVMSPCWITIRSRIDFSGFTRAESHRTLARASATVTHESSTHKNLVTVRNDSLFTRFQRNLPSEPRQRIVRLDCLPELHGLSTVRLLFDVAAQRLAHVHAHFLRLVVFQFQLAFHRHQVELISMAALHVLLARHFSLLVAGADIRRNRYSQTRRCILRRVGQRVLRNRLGTGNHHRRRAGPGKLRIVFQADRMPNAVAN